MVAKTSFMCARTADSRLADGVGCNEEKVEIHSLDMYYGLYKNIGRWSGMSEDQDEMHKITGDGQRVNNFYSWMIENKFLCVEDNI